MTGEQITNEDVRDFTDRLVDFGAQLPPKEQAILREILRKATDTDVEGHAMAMPWSGNQPFANFKDKLQSTFITILEEMGRTSPYYYYEGTIPGVPSISSMPPTTPPDEMR